MIARTILACRYALATEQDLADRRVDPSRELSRVIWPDLSSARHCPRCTQNRFVDNEALGYGEHVAVEFIPTTHAADQHRRLQVARGEQSVSGRVGQRDGDLGGGQRLRDARPLPAAGSGPGYCQRRTASLARTASREATTIDTPGNTKLTQRTNSSAMRPVPISAMELEPERRQRAAGDQARHRSAHTVERQLRN